MEILVAAAASAVVSWVVASKIAAYHFKVIDSYVRELLDISKEEIQKAYVSQDKS